MDVSAFQTRERERERERERIEKECVYVCESEKPRGQKEVGEGPKG